MFVIKFLVFLMSFSLNGYPFLAMPFLKLHTTNIFNIQTTLLYCDNLSQTSNINGAQFVAPNSLSDSKIPKLRAAFEQHAVWVCC